METLNRQATIQEEIERQFTNFKKDGKDRKTVEYMEKRIEALDQYWIEFRKNHDVLLNVLASEHDYFLANNLDRTRDLYYKARTVYQTTLAELEKASARTHQGGTSKTGEAKHEQGAGTHLGTTGNQQPSTSTYNPNLPQGNNTKIDEMLRKQSSNFRAFLRTLESIDVEKLKEKWEYEDALTSIKARWKIVDNLHWELDSQLMGSNNEYEETFTQYERKYNDIKKAINSKLWSVAHREKSTPQLDIPIFSGNYQQWVSFKDLFCEAIHNNPSLSHAQKMQFLKGKLRGEPERLIQHLQISSENYLASWEILKHRYSNKKLI